MDNLEIANEIFTRPIEELCDIAQNSLCMMKIEPRNPNKRMVAQDGLFMMPISLAVPVEATFYNSVAEVTLAQMLKDENGEYVSKPIAWDVASSKWDALNDFKAIQFIFDKQTRGAAGSILSKRGITTHKLFPDATIDKTASFIKEDYECKLKNEQFLKKLGELYWWV